MLSGLLSCALAELPTTDLLSSVTGSDAGSSTDSTAITELCLLLWRGKRILADHFLGSIGIPRSFPMPYLRCKVLCSPLTVVVVAAFLLA